MSGEDKSLDFHALDGLALAASRGIFRPGVTVPSYIAESLGPFLELRHLVKCGLMPPLNAHLALGTLSSLAFAVDQHRDSWISPGTQHIGFIRAVRRGPHAEESMAAFLMAAQRAGQIISLLPDGIPKQLVAAMRELESNIHEHAGAPHTGLLAFRATRDAFEFVVADQGIGILASLRSCPIYAALSDEGTALNAALTEGVSRHGPHSNHGYGFRPIFKGLANLDGLLRFRSGDHALSMDGTTRELPTAQISEKAQLNGFFVSVTCRSNVNNECPRD